MIQGRTVLCFASGYEAPPTSKHHVMHLLARSNTVLWVNYHASRAPSASGSDMLYMARKLAQVLGGLSHPRPNLHVLTPLVLPAPGKRLAKGANTLLLVTQLRAALAKLRAGPLQVWSFAPDIAYLLKYFPAERVVYYCVDDFASFSGYDKAQVQRDEAQLCRVADLVVTTALALQQAKSPLNSRTLLVPHGVDYDHFSQACQDLPEPADLAGIGRPRFGFFGLIRDWVDLDLLAEVARRRPLWHFVLIGDSTVELSAYRALPNMHFLGRIAYSRLPAYCRHFDVGLIPFKINDLTLAVNPIKLREYLAAGLPVISSPLPEARLYERLIHLASTPEEFIAAAESALAGTGQDRLARMRAMASETWPQKVELICRHLMAAGARTRAS